MQGIRVLQQEEDHRFLGLANGWISYFLARVFWRQPLLAG